MLPDQGIVTVDHGEVFGRLVLEYAQLGGDVLLVGGVAVEMVLAEVEQRSHLRAEAC